MVADGYEWFWKIFADGSWEPTTFKIFDTFLTKETVMADIGAWIGPTAIYAAPNVKKIFAFEPDTVAYGALVKNISLSGFSNIVPYPVAVSDKWGGMPFGARTAFGDSMSSTLWAKGDQVPAISLETVLTDLKPDFIKIDIEGGEKTIFNNVRIALEKQQPTIHLSLHTPWFADDLEGYRRAIIDTLDFYPNFYDENLVKIRPEEAFDPLRFNSIIATFKTL